MATRPSRRLAAILSADGVGYSRLMEEDEAGTIDLYEGHLSAVRDRVGEYGGRVVDAVGDNVLAEFSSAVDAVAAAVEIQRSVARLDSVRPPLRRMPFRIGITLGEVIAEGDKIAGSRVNAAARLEALAEPGGVAVSATVRDEVERKLPVQFVDSGERSLKNMRPIRVYQVVIPTTGEAMPRAGELVGWKVRSQLASWKALFLALGAFTGGSILVAATPASEMRSALIGGSTGFSLLSMYLFFRFGIEKIPLSQRSTVTITIVVLLVGFLTVQARGAVRAVSAIMAPGASNPLAAEAPSAARPRQELFAPAGLPRSRAPRSPDVATLPQVPDRTTRVGEPVTRPMPDDPLPLAANEVEGCEVDAARDISPTTTCRSAAPCIVAILSADVCEYRAAFLGFKNAIGDVVVVPYDMQGDFDRGHRILQEVEQAKTDLLLAVGQWALELVTREDPSAPVVYAMVLNPSAVVPDEAEWVTGASINVPPSRTVEVLKELGVRRVGIPYDPERTSYLIPRLEAAALTEGIQPVMRELRSSGDIVVALDSLVRERVDALWALPDAMSVIAFQHMLTVSWKTRVPVVGYSAQQAEKGALVSLFFSSSEDIGRQAGELAMRVLEGESPREMPYTEARMVEVVVNQKAASELGVAVPRRLLSTARLVPGVPAAPPPPVPALVPWDSWE